MAVVYDIGSWYYNLIELYAQNQYNTGVFTLQHSLYILRINTLPSGAHPRDNPIRTYAAMHTF